MMLNLMTLLISLTNADKDSVEYDKCIEAHHCEHDGEDLSKLHKEEYIKTMKCRIIRHMECIKTEIPKDKE